MLKSRIFSLTADLIFQFFVGEAWGERRIMFCKLKGNQDVVFSYCLRSLTWKGYPSTLRFIATQGASDLITTTLSSRPYCIVSALITNPRSQMLRPGKATKYRIDIPVWDDVVLQDLLISAPKKQKGNTGANKGCIGVMPFSYAQREAAIDSIGTNLQELGLSMPALATTAVGKEDWWIDEMKLLCAV